MLAAIWEILLELSPWLLLGTAVAALLHVTLPERFVERHLRGRGDVAKAVALGVPLPLCSCGVIPAGVGLKKDGASDGAAIGFLVSTPQTGVDSILVSASFLGWPFALFKVASAALTGLAAGALVHRFGGGDITENEASVGATCPIPEDKTQKGWRDGLDHGVEVLQSIWRWLIIGVMISAALTVWIPTDSIGSTVWSNPLVAGVVMLTISVPLYVCATASVPIAAALVAAGFPAGAALVFLMAGPATNVATIGAVKEAFGIRTTFLYLGTIIVGSLGLGMLFDFVLAANAVTHNGHHDHTTWWATGATIILLGLLAKFAFDELAQFWSKYMANQDTTPAIEVGVEGMTCGGCSSRLQKVLSRADGVESALVELEAKKAIVRGTIDESQVRVLIEQAGFDPV